MVRLKEDIIFVLPTGFGNSVYSPEHSRIVRSKTFAVVVSLLEYIRKQQVPKRTE